MSFGPLMEQRSFFSVSSGILTFNDVGGMGQCGGSTTAVSPQNGGHVKSIDSCGGATDVSSAFMSHPMEELLAVHISLWFSM
jgi:hypothetical protein